MRVLIVIPRYEYGLKKNYYYWFPFGLAFISSILKKEGHHVECLNLNHHDGFSKDLIAKKLDSKKYDVVCTGGMALIYHELEIVISAANSHESQPITILGGTLITTEPELIFNAIKPSIGVLGEGEITIVELLKCLSTAGDLTDVNGIIFKDKKGDVHITPDRELTNDLDSLPMPDFEGMGFEEKLNHTRNTFSYELSVNDHPRVYPLLASRSCPFQCTFCYHEAKYRKRSLKNIMEELDFMVKRYRINIITIYDECFSFDKHRLLDFCTEINRLRSEIDWDLKWSCQLIVNSVDKETLSTMKKAGCFMISYGFESYSPVVLKSMHKFITPQKIDAALKDTMESHLVIRAGFIFGDIAETKETAKETLNYWKNNCKGQINIVFIQPYPGSFIYKHCVKKGLIRDRLSFIKSLANIGSKPAINMTDAMTDAEIKHLEHEINYSVSKYCRFVTPFSKKRLEKNVYEFKTKCPFCHKTNTYGNFYIEKSWYYGAEVMCKECYMTYYMCGIIHKTGYLNYARIKKAFNLSKEAMRLVKRKLT